MKRETIAVPEKVVRLRVNGLPVGTWTASPRALEELAAGRLVSLGHVRSRDDLLGIDVRVDPQGDSEIDARVAPERAAAAKLERDHRREHGCGLRFLIDCRPDLLRPRRELAPPGFEAFPALFRELFDQSPSRRTTGGHHTTALSDGSGLSHIHEEVGRHNGADKAIGSALLAGEDLARLGMITTARISGEIAEKAARAGLAWVASRSVPTTMAVEIAEAARMSLVARAAGPEARVFP